jgi:hypothetical protein
MSYDSRVLADSPDGYWPLDDSSGSSTARDASGNGHAGTPTSVTFGSTGYANDGSTAASFNGSSSHISIPFPAFSAAPLSIEFIFKPSSTSPVGVWDGAPSQTNVIRQYSAGNCEWWSGDPSVALSLPDTNAHHLALVFEIASSHRRVTYYLDGLQKSQTTGSTSTSLTWTNPFQLGNINSGGAGWYNGTLQKFALWKSALTATQVKNHFLGWIAGSSNDDRVTRVDVEFAYTPVTNFTPFAPPPVIRKVLEELQEEDELILPRKARIISSAVAAVADYSIVQILQRKHSVLFDQEIEEWLDQLAAMTRKALYAAAGAATVPRPRTIIIIGN